jgi:peptidoglycan/LPS O-acetylase OafA/YrhL
MAYFVLCLGFLGLSEGSVSSRWPDYSYGIYIYAFPVMFVLQREFGFQSPYPLAIANLACTIPFAAASWHLVEKPVLDWLKHYRKSMAKSCDHPVPVMPDPVAPGAA